MSLRSCGIRIGLGKLVLAPCAHALFGLELRHAEQMAQHLEPVTLRQLDQFGNSFSNEGDGLVRPPFLTSA